MRDTLPELMSVPGLEAAGYPPTSRYHGVTVKTRETSAGRQEAYLKRRFVPQPDRFVLLNLHQIVQGDRLDNLAHRYLGDAEQYWRMCDANGTMRPAELTEIPGAELRITLPEGVPGGTDV